MDLKKNQFLLNKVVFFGFFVFLFSILISLRTNILYGDEVFYWFQSREIFKSFKFVNFNNTQPLFYPLILAFAPNPFVGRLFNLFFILLAIYFFATYVNEYQIFNKKNQLARLLTISIFFFSPYTVFVGVSLYTEALFTLILISLFWIKNHIYNNKHIFIYGILLGLLTEIRITGVWVLLFLAAYHLIKTRNLSLKNSLPFFIGIAFLIPYIAIGGFSFIREKSHILSSIDFYKKIVFSRSASLNFFLGPMKILLVIGCLTSFVKKNKEGVFHVIFITSFFLSSVFFLSFFDRYWYILLPSIVFLSLLGIESINVTLKEKLFAKLLVFSFLIILQINFFIRNRQLINPDALLKNRYFLSTPKECQEIRTLKLISSSDNRVVKLPYFTQPRKSLYIYQGIIIAKDSYYYLILNYLDDYGNIFLNNKKIAFYNNPLDPAVIKIDLKKNEKVILRLDVFNNNIIGGLGQILFCRSLISNL